MQQGHLRLHRSRPADLSQSEQFMDLLAQPYTDLLLLLTSSGRLMLMDKDGSLITSVSAPSAPGRTFRCLSGAAERVFVGTNDGKILVFSSASLAFLFSIPRQTQCLASAFKPECSNPSPEAVDALLATKSAGSIVGQYSDGSIQVLDLNSSKIVSFQLNVIGKPQALAVHPRQNSLAIAANTSFISVSRYILHTSLAPQLYRHRVLQAWESLLFQCVVVHQDTNVGLASLLLQRRNRDGDRVY